MADVLLDTSVASFFLPRRERPEKRLYERDVLNHVTALSFQSVAELWRLAEANGWASPRRSALDAYVRSFVVIPYDYELSRVWGRVMAEADRTGRPFEAGDGWIAATAVHHSLPLVTHDRDFLGRKIAGLRVVSRLAT